MTTDWFKEFEKKDRLEQGEKPPNRSSFKLFVQDHPILVFSVMVGGVLVWVLFGGDWLHRVVKQFMG